MNKCHISSRDGIISYLLKHIGGDFKAVSLPLILQIWLFACLTILNQSNNNPQHQTWRKAEKWSTEIQHWENATVNSTKLIQLWRRVCLTSYAVWRNCKLVQWSNKQFNEMEQIKIQSQICWHCCDALYFGNKPSLQDITWFYHMQTERWISEERSLRSSRESFYLTVPNLVSTDYIWLSLLQSLQCNVQNTVWPNIWPILQILHLVMH